ncbi:MAG: hypothetical protein ACRDTT_01290 [Pseudonocardiaceae bacterium]
MNTALVREELAYGELYATMPLDLIRRMRQLVTAARQSRQNGSGFWPQEDVTIDARVQLQGLPDLPELIMFPKLYRRLVTYFRAGNVGLASFDTWVRADPVNRDDTALLPTGELGNLHDLYDVSPDGIRLRLLPEDLTFQPDPPFADLPDYPSLGQPFRAVSTLSLRR